METIQKRRSERSTDTAIIKNIAYQIGFTQVGITDAKPISAWNTYKQWIDKNMHGAMHYLEKHCQLRSCPTQLMENAQSILMCCLGYRIPSHAEPSDSSINIAKYAYGIDYHRIMKSKLKRLVHALRIYFGDTLCTRIFCDTAPILEKAYAQEAGLGWIGKNTLLIHPAYGSFVVLGGILLNTPLLPDTPMHNQCGACNQCIQQCPTQAISSPYQLDASNCISYWTIEAKSNMQAVINERAGNWLFGCDRCQECCPYNKSSYFTLEPQFYPQHDKELYTRKHFLQMDEQAFRLFFKHSAILRMGYESFHSRLLQIQNS